MKIQISEDQYEKLKKEIKKDESKFITCEGCNKKFTQTIYKGKKSKPICPHCGKVNKDS
jgi:rRNA maturation endonuclease Nob1